MTWYLPAGETVISPELRPLIAQSVLHMVSELDAEKEMEFQVPVFDELTPDQKIVALYKVAFGLMDPKTHAVEHTAALEGCIAALFNLCAEYVDAEITAAPDRYLWRGMIRTAYHLLYQKTIPWDADLARWRAGLETLEDEILWDNDWSLAPVCNKALLGISPDYFSAQTPTPKMGKFQSVREKLIEFCESIVDE